MGEDSATLLVDSQRLGWRLVTSTFTEMEIIAVVQEEQYVEIRRLEGLPFRNIYREILGRVTDVERLRMLHGATSRRLQRRFPSIEYLWLGEDGWVEASRLCGETDIDPGDCIQVATAKLNNSDLFVTRDANLRARIQRQLPGYIEVAEPREVIERLTQQGFTLAT